MALRMDEYLEDEKAGEYTAGANAQISPEI